jgi:hypothetical protein
MVLGQRAVDQKSNEITAIPALVKAEVHTRHTEIASGGAGWQPKTQSNVGM